MPEPRRQLPSVHRLLQEQRIRELTIEFSHDLVVETIRTVLDRVRAGGSLKANIPRAEELIDEIIGETVRRWAPSLRPVINASGVIIHTNLGRAPLSDEAIKAMEEVARGYSNLEYDLEAGERGSRHTHLELLLCQVTGAEAAMAVNNNASAVLLALSALASGKEVIVSRGQAVEIGGGFRIPDVMRQSGAKLVEVGTTNRTYGHDYEGAISPETALFLKVHSSNFRVIGFTHEVSLEELVTLGSKHGVAVMEDLGSGALLDTSQFGLAHEPQAQEAVATGATVCCFSGDKLLGGPQAGIVVCRKEAIDRLKRHPLARAVRIDKLSIAALDATLRHYARGEALTKIPVWQMISVPLDVLDKRASHWADSVGHWGIKARVVNGESTVGGGSLPGETLPTKLLALSPGEDRVESLARELRRCKSRHPFSYEGGRDKPSIVGRIERGALLLDPRTVLPDQDEALLEGLRSTLSAEKISVR